MIFIVRHSYLLTGKQFMHYHLIGICGTAMASLAGMLQARGHQGDGLGPECLSADVDAARGTRH